VDGKETVGRLLAWAELTAFDRGDPFFQMTQAFVKGRQDAKANLYCACPAMERPQNFGLHVAHLFDQVGVHLFHFTAQLGAHFDHRAPEHATLMVHFSEQLRAQSVDVTFSGWKIILIRHMVPAR